MAYLIALEGIDASGKGTQARLLAEHFKSQGRSCELLSFPFYEKTVFGREIGKYLNGEFGSFEQVHPKLAATLFACDRFEARPQLLSALAANDVVICDRYVPSNIAHQVARVDESQAAAFAQWIEQVEYEVFALPRPDLVVFLHMPPELAFELVSKKAGRSYTTRKRDLHEEQAGYLVRTSALFGRLAAQDPAWITLDCVQNGELRSVESIQSELCRRVTERLAARK